MIKISNLSKTYGQVHAVKNVSLNVKKGEIVGLLGRNGAGKTTIMKMITGYLEPTKAVLLWQDLMWSKIDWELPG
jgi:ABC-2 type transport system ATP-binding protein